MIKTITLLAILIALPVSRASDESSAPAAPQPTIVTSEKLSVDYLQNIGTFSGNVLVIDPRITVRADQMVVWFERATNTMTGSRSGELAGRQLSRILAKGGVVITLNDRKAKADEAEYTAHDGRVVLSGQPELNTPDGRVSGETIVFWRDTKKIEVESRTRLLFYPDEPRIAPTESNSTP
ncbi:MAG: hypothetical protein N3A53_08730 [Verrucomicrobiae bacterium]|nr:hypothetical protein [Verrucomicrobiae bacterium]